MNGVGWEGEGPCQLWAHEGREFGYPADETMHPLRGLESTLLGVLLCI
jgi:hypothetical protein